METNILITITLNGKNRKCQFIIGIIYLINWVLSLTLNIKNVTEEYNEITKLISRFQNIFFKEGDKLTSAPTI